MELTNKQTDRQDFVDNLITQMVQDLDPTCYVEHDIEYISAIRDTAYAYLIKSGTLLNEEDFYPYLED